MLALMPALILITFTYWRLCIRRHGTGRNPDNVVFICRKNDSPPDSRNFDYGACDHGNTPIPDSGFLRKTLMIHSFSLRAIISLSRLKLISRD